VKPSHEIVRAGAKMIVPVMLLFAAYLASGGVDTPGGGFAAGGAFALGLIVYALAFGVDAARAALPAWLARAALAVGLLGFVALGVFAVARGHAFLDYDGLADSYLVRTQRLGVTIAELCVALSTAGAMIVGFYALAGRAGDMKEQGW
jgi:multicomponent Na+:H+ antiporter subunit B